MRKTVNEKEGEQNGKFLGSGGKENERQMANNVNCEEMRFVIRNLVDVDDPPRQRRQKFLLMSARLRRYFPKEEGMMQHSSGRYFPQ